MNRWNTHWNADMVTVGLFFLVLALVAYIHRWRVLRRLPPGPRGVPILGCLPFVGREPHKTLRQLSEQYGPVFSVYLGSKLCVFISDVKLVREAFKKDVFANRPSIPFVDVLMEGYEPQLLHLLGDLFGAGLGTTQTTLCWFLLAMMKHPEIQIKVQEELDTVVGRERKPCLSDLPQLPYTEATLMETQRYATILPTGISHAAAYDTELGGYLIPKNAVVSGLFWNFHHDPKVWKNPDTFDPTHFLTPEGKIFKPDNFMPFSV
uniref:Cytochrome P450 n=1 Tax=Strigamia maritima TaxID=126957 RepID=T1JPJ8_STRMM